MENNDMADLIAAVQPPTSQEMLMNFGRRTIDNSDRTSASSADEQYAAVSASNGGGASGVVSVTVLALVAAIATFGVMYLLRGTPNAVVAAQGGSAAAPESR